MFFVALRSPLTLLCWRRGSATMAHLAGASKKRKRDEEAIIRTLTSQMWRDFVLRLHERYLQVAFLQQFVYLNAQQMIQANALPPLP